MKSIILMNTLPRSTRKCALVGSEGRMVGHRTHPSGCTAWQGWWCIRLGTQPPHASRTTGRSASCRRLRTAYLDLWWRQSFFYYLDRFKCGDKGRNRKEKKKERGTHVTRTRVILIFHTWNWTDRTRSYFQFTADLPLMSKSLSYL